jgi:hypothetical protein
MPVSRTALQTSLSAPRAVELVDGTGLVGSIDVNRLQFTGFADPGEAAAAAWVAHVAVERRKARGSREAPPRLEYPRLFLVRTDGEEWITGGGTRLARLVRPSSQDNSVRSHDTASAPAHGSAPAQWFGIEIGFSPDTSEVTLGSHAHVIYLALRRSGIPWSARSRDATLVSASAPAASRATQPRIALPSMAAPRTAYAGIGG